jgi:hypothetical protein
MILFLVAIFRGFTSDFGNLFFSGAFAARTTAVAFAAIIAAACLVLQQKMRQEGAEKFVGNFLVVALLAMACAAYRDYVITWNWWGQTRVYARRLQEKGCIYITANDHDYGTEIKNNHISILLQESWHPQSIIFWQSTVNTARWDPCGSFDGKTIDPLGEPIPAQGGYFDFSGLVAQFPKRR